MKKLLLVSLLFLGCLQPSEQGEPEDPSQLLIQMNETSYGQTIQLQIKDKGLRVDIQGQRLEENLSFVELKKLADFLNATDFFNTPLSFETCSDCPSYDLFVKLQKKEKRIQTSNQRLSGPVAELVKQLQEIRPLPEPPSAPSQTAYNSCIQLCFAARRQIDLRFTPCLADTIALGWACDIVHQPKQPIDNQTPYVCPSLLQQKKKHVVELNENCQLVQIR